MLVKRFRGQVVKRLRRVPGGLRLTLLANRAGQRGRQLTITQRQWQADGSIRYQPGMTLAQLRADAS